MDGRLGQLIRALVVHFSQEGAPPDYFDITVMERHKQAMVTVRRGKETKTWLEDYGKRTDGTQ